MTTPGAVGLLELEVGAIAAGGGCVARAPDGRVVFVRHALPGEVVVARVTATTTSYLRADAVDILKPSADRVPPPCPHAGPGRCGGCDFQHVELSAQRRLKAFRVAEQLERVAGVERAVEVEPVAGDGRGLGWRSRVRLAVDDHGAVGFHRHRSHELEHVDTCPIASPAVAATGALRVRWPGVAHVEVVVGSRPAEAVVSVTPRGRGVPRLPDVDAGVVVRGTVTKEPGAVHATVCGRTYRISAGVFWQVHTGAADALLPAVLAMAGDCRGAAVVDLYAGAGLFSVPLAEAVGPAGTVLAVERDARGPCEDARHNAGGVPDHAGQAGRGDATARRHRASVTPTSSCSTPHGRAPAPRSSGHWPRTAASGGWSTWPATRRRSPVTCGPLLTVGWHLAELRAFDIFPMTEHVELVAAIEPTGR